METRKTRRLSAGGVAIGGGAPVTVQTMTRSPLADIEAGLAELAAARAAGCDIARAAVPSLAAAAAFGRLAARSPLPLVADTHFDWRIAVAAIREGAAKVRINPGNMSPDGLARVVEAAGERGIPVRVGGNSGSIRRDGSGTGRALPEFLAEETLSWAERMRGMGFHDIVLSLKANSAADTVRAYRLAAARTDLPLHLGVTAAGPREDALLKSVAAVGSLLIDGIGDTIRLSFTGDPLGEVRAGIDLLRAVGLRRDGPEIIACPACGRCRVDLPELVARVKAGLVGMSAPLRVAVMGCEVNGPGEARDADIGLASAGGTVHLFVKGEVTGKVSAAEAVERLVAAAKELAGAHGP